MFWYISYTYSTQASTQSDLSLPFTPSEGSGRRPRPIVAFLVVLTAIIAGTAQAGRYGAAVDPDYDQTVLAWDNEKSKADPPPDAADRGKIDQRVNTFTVIGTAGYSFHPRWDISFGAGKGFADDDNSGEALEFTNGDWSVGSSIGWTFWQKQRRRLNLSVSLEYNLSQSEPDVSFDLGYGVSF